MFDSSKVENTNRQYISKYLNVGVQDLKINGIEIKVAKTGSKQLIFSAEGEEVKDLGFESVDGAKGPVGKISTSYFKAEKESDITKMFAEIADAIGTREQLNAVKAETLEEYVAKATPILTGKFASFKVTGEEYSKSDGKIGVKLGFGKFFVEKKGIDRLKFDKTNSYDYKKLVQPDNIGFDSLPGNNLSDELPF